MRKQMIEGRKCGEINSSAAVKCGTCGEPVPKEDRFLQCPVGHYYKGDTKNCPYCPPDGYKKGRRPHIIPREIFLDCEMPAKRTVALLVTVTSDI